MDAHGAKTHRQANAAQAAAVFVAPPGRVQVEPAGVSLSAQTPHETVRPLGETALVGLDGHESDLLVSDGHDVVGVVSTFDAGWPATGTGNKMDIGAVRPGPEVPVLDDPPKRSVRVPIGQSQNRPDGQLRY
jgi:hypothetical protein